MRWKRIPKERTLQPETGKYSDWKPILAKEGFYQCVYCAIHESCFGGSRNFHVEHYRPKSKTEFKKLENDIKNLFYACPICNTFKGDDWPDAPKKDYSNPSYPYPAKVDYTEIFMNNSSSGAITGKYIAAKYMIEKLYLNRPQLIIERRIYMAFLRLKELEAFFREAIAFLEKTKDAKYIHRIAKSFIDVSDLHRQLRDLRPYAESDIRR
jgi:hypothetical protein